LRDFIRDDSRCPVRLRLQELDDRQIRGESRNISLGGMYLVSTEVDAPFVLGGRVRVEIDVASNDPVLLRTEGQIVRFETLHEGGRPLVGVAVKFDEVLEYHFPSDNL